MKRRAYLGFSKRYVGEFVDPSQYMLTQRTIYPSYQINLRISFKSTSAFGRHLFSLDSHVNVGPLFNFHVSAVTGHMPYQQINVQRHQIAVTIYTKSILSLMPMWCTTIFRSASFYLSDFRCIYSPSHASPIILVWSS